MVFLSWLVVSLVCSSFSFLLFVRIFFLFFFCVLMGRTLHWRGLLVSILMSCLCFMSSFTPKNWNLWWHSIRNFRGSPSAGISFWLYTGEDNFFLRKRDNMRRWLCCSRQVEESYSKDDHEVVKSPKNYAEGISFFSWTLSVLCIFPWNLWRSHCSFILIILCHYFLAVGIVDCSQSKNVHGFNLLILRFFFLRFVFVHLGVSKFSKSYWNYGKKNLHLWSIFS